MLWLWVYLVLFVLYLLGLAEAEWNRAAFRGEIAEKFPPISDKEFIALCSPGTNPILALEVRRIISDSLGIEYASVYPSASLVNDYDAC